MDTLPKPLASLLRELSPIALAFSGGLDSRFLAHAARLSATDIHLFHATGPHVPAAESAQAKTWAEARGFGFTAVPADPLELSEVRAGIRERCYFCKRLLFTRLGAAAHEHFSGRATLCDGSNASDRLLFRPGLRALKELEARSPLADADLDKTAIRAIAAASGLDDPNQQARPCMLTRFAYDLAPSHEALAAVAEAEQRIAALLRPLFPLGLPDFRLRMVGTLDTTDNPGPGPALPYRTELHLSVRPDAPGASYGAGASGALYEPDAETRRKLQEIVSGQGFAAPLIVILDAVSGHYDRLDGK